MIVDDRGSPWIVVVHDHRIRWEESISRSRATVMYSMYLAHPPCVGSRHELEGRRGLERKLGWIRTERFYPSTVAAITTNHKVAGALLAQDGMYIHAKSGLDNDIPGLIK